MNAGGAKAVAPAQIIGSFSTKVLTPTDLTSTQTDQYDPNPRERVALREWHLTLSTPQPTSQLEFVTYHRPYRGKDANRPQLEFKPLDGGYLIEIETDDVQTTVLLPTDDTTLLRSGQRSTTGQILIHAKHQDGEEETVTARLSADHRTN